MSEKKDQPPDSKSQSTGVAQETYDEFLTKITNLNELRKIASYNVLHAFTAETLEISSERIMIAHDLVKTFKIHPETYDEFERKLKSDPLVLRMRKASKASDKKEEKKDTASDKKEEKKDTASDKKEEKKDTASDKQEEKKDTANEERKVTAGKGRPVIRASVVVKDEDLVNYQESLNVGPAKIHGEKEKPSSASDDDSLVPSWGRVSPQSLVGKWVNIRMPGEKDYISFQIKNYNAETEMHHLVNYLSQTTAVDLCDWIDIRHVPAEDIVWKDGHPGFPARKCFLKPGETILCTTSTVQQKKRVTEVGKTPNGIPIIRKLDKGKGIA